MSILETAIGWLAPPACVGCGDEGMALCLGCAGKITEFEQFESHRPSTWEWVFDNVLS